jgi:hypothetical protein
MGNLSLIKYKEISREDRCGHHQSRKPEKLTANLSGKVVFLDRTF